MSFPEIVMKPIGIIHTPFKRVSDGIPIQGRLHPGAEGHIDLFDEYRDAGRDLDGFSHLFLLFYMHVSTVERMITKPYMDTVTRGVLSTRSPHRPNHLGLTLVRLIGIEAGSLTIRDVDMVDGTPLLDIKPYNPLFDAASKGEEVKTGWMKKISLDDSVRGTTKTRSHEEWLQENE
ncbi:MAG: tRNA (N6-threonylcarbamoyladenosine(37)-N6)-methyltransferase TrmO [Spirochaetes bacterium]|nr:tRNA (N6-threonylcarbamoyladenosine(37)-N6)-methyltransferase TrmO [Spirochaetota bacterium]